MAERRMFSKKIIDSDEFLDMPLNAQCLYFHLSMQADDDGFVGSHKKILRSIGAGECDMALLIEKKFIIAFDSGIVAIRHWKVHNYIAKDRYRATMFLEEKKKLSCDENGAYVEDKDAVYNSYTNCIQPVDNPYTNCIQPVYKVYTQDSIGKDSIDKDSLGKGRVGKESKEEERIEKDNLGEGSINTPPPPHENKYEEDFSSEWAVAPFPTGKCLLEEQHHCEAPHLQEERNRHSRLDNPSLRSLHLTTGQHHYEEPRLPEDEYYSQDGFIAPEWSNQYLLEDEDKGLTPCEEGKVDEASHTGRGVSFADGEGKTKELCQYSPGDNRCKPHSPVGSESGVRVLNDSLNGCQTPNVPEPRRDRGTASAVDEVLSSKYDETENAVLKPIEGPYGRIAFPSGGRGTASAVDEVLSGKYDETENAVLKPIEGPYGRIAFPSGGRGTASAVDEVLSGKYDETENAVLKPIEGPYSRGIVRLTDGQLADLKERLGEHQLNRYMDKLASFITSRGARIRSHYDTLIKWYEEDFKNQSATAKPQAYEPSNKLTHISSEKPRYGSFDPTEAFRHAMERTKREFELEMNEGLREG